jgi:hypothetical protein
MALIAENDAFVGDLRGLWGRLLSGGEIPSSLVYSAFLRRFVGTPAQELVPLPEAATAELIVLDLDD